VTKSNKLVALELQDLLIEAGFDVSIAPYQNCEVGKTTGFDLRVEYREPDTDDDLAFLDRLLIEDDASQEKVKLTWQLFDELFALVTVSAIPIGLIPYMKRVYSSKKLCFLVDREHLEGIVQVTPISEAKSNIRKQKFRRVGRDAYGSLMGKSSTSDSSQAEEA